jgi:hypothetical protein
MATISETTTKVQDTLSESAAKVQGTVKEYAAKADLSKVQDTVKEYAAKVDASKVQDTVKELAAKVDASKAQDTVFEYLQKAEDAVVSGVKTASEKAEGYVPEIKVPADVPTGDEVVENSFGFFQRLLDNQHAFAKALLTAANPVRSKIVRPVVAAPKTTKATTSKKAA